MAIPSKGSSVRTDSRLRVLLPPSIVVDFFHFLNGTLSHDLRGVSSLRVEGKDAVPSLRVKGKKRAIAAFFIPVSPAGSTHSLARMRESCLDKTMDGADGLFPLLSSFKILMQRLKRD